MCYSINLNAPLPSERAHGIDPVSLALDAAADKAQRALVTTATPDSLAQLLAVQQAVALSYEEQVLIPRRDIWNTTLAIVREDPPEIAGEIQERSITARCKGKLQWHYQSLDTQRNLAITSQVTADIELGSLQDTSDRRELRAAVGYLIGAGASVFRKGKVPDELLGVKAEGKLRWKQIPRAALRSAVVEALQDVDTLGLLVSTRAIGTAATTPLFDVEVRRSDLEAGGHHLQPQNVSGIYEDLKNGFRGGAVSGRAVRRPTLQHAETFLNNTYLRDGIGQDFTTIQSINLLLARSEFITSSETTPK